MEKFCNEAYYTFFSTLANQTSLEIIDILKDGPKALSEISVALKQNQTATFQNLKQLKECWLVLSEENGDEKRYSLNLEIVMPLGNLLAFHVAKHCPGLKKCIPEEKLKEYLKSEAAKETYVEHE
jgi:DNA-binding transcriptional ArsR family regulator